MASAYPREVAGAPPQHTSAWVEGDVGEHEGDVPDGAPDKPATGG
jgi:hypothetical protein